jgi:hypothetical protein
MSFNIGNRPWKPGDISTTAWYDAADTSTITESGGSVSQWDDKSGNGYHAFELTASNQPQTGVDTINGLNVLTVDQDYLRAVTPTGVPAGTFPTSIQITGVIKKTGSPLTFEAFATRTVVGTPAPIDNFNERRQIGNSGTDTFLTGVDIRTLTDTTILSELANTSGLKEWVNGTLNMDESSGTYADNSSVLLLGTRGDAVTRFRGQWGEFIFTTELSESDRQKVEGYLAWKWGLVANLPDSHPYKYEPPVYATKLPEWTPALTDTIGWWDSSDAATITESSGSVSQWDDKSGNGFDLTQLNGSRQPRWGVGAQINGLNVIHYEGTLDNMEALVSPAQGYTEGMAISVGEARLEGDYPTLFHMNSTDGTDILDMRMQCGPTSGKINNVFRLDGTGYILQSAQDAQLAEETPFISSFWWDGLSAYNYVNGGALTATVDVPDGLTFTVDNFGVGRYSNTPKNYQGELILLNTTDTDTRQRVEGYLAWKWGLVDRLPVDHPYKNDKPRQTGFWTPEQTTTAAWYDASDTNTITESGGAVSQWSDKSGNSNHATQGTGTNQPTTNSRTMNGLNTLDFDGVDSFMDAPAFGVTNPASVFFVFEVDNDGSYMIIDRGSGFDRFTGDNDSYPQLFVDSRFDGLPTGMPTTGAHIVSKQCDVTSTYDTYLNGTLAHSAIATTKTFTDAVSIIGGTTGGAGNRLDGAISEIIVLDENPSLVTRQKIEGYLAWKWGLVSNLPVDHPYKSFPPII